MKKSITTYKAQQILSKNGLKVSEKEAEIILDYLYNLATLTIEIQK